MKKLPFNFSEGVKGILVTCNKGNESRCISEIIQILEQANEDRRTENPISVKPGNHSEETFSSALGKDIIYCQANRQRDFQAVHLSKLKGLVFIKINTCDPNLLVNQIFDITKEGPKYNARFCLRVLPLPVICPAKLEDICKAVRPLINEYFAHKPLTYAIIVETRISNNLKKKVVIDAIADTIGSAHKVDLETPEVVIMIQVMHNFCGIGILHQYYERKKYNIQEYSTS